MMTDSRHWLLVSLLVEKYGGLSARAAPPLTFAFGFSCRIYVFQLVVTLYELNVCVQAAQGATYIPERFSRKSVELESLVHLLIVSRSSLCIEASWFFLKVLYLFLAGLSPGQIFVKAIACVAITIARRFGLMKIRTRGETFVGCCLT